MFQNGANTRNQPFTGFLYQMAMLCAAVLLLGSATSSEVLHSNNHDAASFWDNSYAADSLLQVSSSSSSGSSTSKSSRSTNSSQNSCTQLSGAACTRPDGVSACREHCCTVSSCGQVGGTCVSQQGRAASVSLRSVDISAAVRMSQHDVCWLAWGCDPDRIHAAQPTRVYWPNA